MTKDIFVNVLATLTIFSVISISGAIQCYSCQGAGPNEVEANIRCLETSYLENCDDFYEYYSEVEETKPSEDDYDEDYYYYDEYYDEDEEEEVPPTSRDKSRDERKPTTTGLSRGRSRDEAPDIISRPRGKRAAARSGSASSKEGNDFGNDLSGGRAKALNASHKEEFDYTAFEDEEYDYGGSFRFTKPAAGDKPSRKSEKAATKESKPESSTEEEAVTEGIERPQISLPKDPEHWCYSQTTKNAWESYKVEKGCKKISYCKEHAANFPEWGLPWNFCCDKSRCNAKLVKDKPQRIYGMGCRRTDDCIQGHTNRPVCPGMFQSCPRISSTLIKMECRIKSQPSGGRKYVATYFDKFKEKKCFCTGGYFARGPICTSGGAPDNVPRVHIVIVFPISLFLLARHNLI